MLHVRCPYRKVLENNMDDISTFFRICRRNHLLLIMLLGRVTINIRTAETHSDEMRFPLSYVEKFID